MPNSIWTQCRLCQGELASIYDFGNHALHCVYPLPGQAVPVSPLHLLYCTKCGLHQLSHSVDPSDMYKEGYGYKSGLNSTMRRHFEGVIAQAISLKPALDVWLDIGCNDGTLLDILPPGIARFGMDPQAPEGPRYTRGYFSGKLWRKYYGFPVDVITSLAMIYDLDDIDGFIKDIAEILADDGIWIVEFADLQALYAGAWDVISHEHVVYLDPGQVAVVAQRHGLICRSCARNPMNGGSSRMVFERAGMNTKRQIQFNASYNPNELGRSIGRSIQLLGHLIGDLLNNGEVIWVLGASQKGNTLLQALTLTDDEIGQAVDRMPEKSGRVTPGSNIPIIHEDEVVGFPDYYLVLPWHLRDELIEREAKFLEGGSFIFPLPRPELYP